MAPRLVRALMRVRRHSRLSLAAEVL
jgi:hypothetical protein